MKKLLFLAAILPACVVGTEGGQTPPGEDPPGEDPPPGTGISGRISADTTWAGPTSITGATIIDPGVTVTVMAGASLELGASIKLDVQGTLNVVGAKGSEVIIQGDPASATEVFHGGITAQNGGTVTMSYAIQHHGALRTEAGGTVNATDTKLFGVNGDALIMTGGTVNISYSQIGADIGVTDTTHCNLHFGGTGNQISITKSKINGTPYALMFYEGTAAIFTENNWEMTATATPTFWVDSAAGVVGDFSGGYFSNGFVLTPKANAVLTMNNLSATPLLDAGVR